MSDDRDTDLSPAALKGLLDRGEPVDLIDVREPYEWEIVRLPGARLVPMDQWLDGTALATLRAGHRPVFYCRTGVRTREVLGAVREAGIEDAAHLAGGIVAWAYQIDPRMPVY